MFITFIVFPIIYFIFMFFCCVYSGIMMSQIKEAMDCKYNCSGKERKYFIMAKFCFASSFIMLVMSIIATPIILRRMRKNKFYPRDYAGTVQKNYYYYYITTTFIFFIAAACLFLANFILIPSTIFIKYKKERSDLRPQY